MEDNVENRVCDLINQAYNKNRRMQTSTRRKR